LSKWKDSKNWLPEFINAFPNSESDLSLNLDSKHKSIIKTISNPSTGIGSISLKNLRNWSGQSDLGAPITLNYMFQNKFSNPKDLVRYLNSKTLGKKSHKYLKQSLNDDLAVLKKVGAYNLLCQNPVDLTPGETLWVSDGVARYNMRWLRYAYLANAIISKSMLPQSGTWMDIGSFYGGLQSIVKKYNPTAKFIMVDFYHQLFRSYVYLQNLFPHSNHLLGLNPGQKIPDDSFVYIPVQEYSKLLDLKIDLSTNFFSFGEMPRNFFESYIKSNPILNSQLIYTVNRVVSSPFFEPTYETDLTVLDYRFKGFDVQSFDIFPMHHYLRINREFLGKKYHRNISSSYFELIAINTKT
jgi:putative sugar O-methyltransferase